MFTLELKKLPVGIQTFKKIIEENYLYIDKTDIAYDLITKESQYIFLSRPRRFGKSLFLDTLHNIFEGNQELFKGLAIYDKWDWKISYPVIKISFDVNLRSISNIEDSLRSSLEDNQERLGVECKTNSNVSVCFKEFIKAVSKKYNQQVVVLIDEYDKAILDNLDQMEVAKEARELIKGFYTVLKGSDAYLRFVFLTGVSKFSRASIFSGLNMLTDISLNKKYGDICGYSQNDIETSFQPYLKDVDLEKFKRWYNGYNFLKSDMYNPFDVLQFIANDFTFENYWFATGTPTYLIKLIEKNNYYLPQLSNLTVDKKLLDSFDIENIDLEVILYQSGYLTIKSITIDEDDDILYNLVLPNLEVKKSLNNFIITHLYQDKSLQNKTLSKALREHNLEMFETSLKSIFASIPYNNYANNNIQHYEGFYASIIYVYLQSLGLRIIGEDVTNKGRIDLTIVMSNYIYIIEFKVGSDDALKQIKEKNYVQKYQNRNKYICLVGINFDENEKNISKFEWEKL